MCSLENFLEIKCSFNLVKSDNEYSCHLLKQYFTTWRHRQGKTFAWNFFFRNLLKKYLEKNVFLFWSHDHHRTWGRDCFHSEIFKISKINRKPWRSTFWEQFQYLIRRLFETQKSVSVSSWIQPKLTWFKRYFTQVTENQLFKFLKAVSW